MLLVSNVILVLIYELLEYANIRKMYTNIKNMIKNLIIAQKLAVLKYE